MMLSPVVEILIRKPLQNMSSAGLIRPTLRAYDAAAVMEKMGT